MSDSLPVFHFWGHTVITCPAFS